MQKLRAFTPSQSGDVMELLALFQSLGMCSYFFWDHFVFFAANGVIKKDNLGTFKPSDGSLADTVSAACDRRGDFCGFNLIRMVQEDFKLGLVPRAPLWHNLEHNAPRRGHAAGEASSCRYGEIRPIFFNMRRNLLFRRIAILSSSRQSVISERRYRLHTSGNVSLRSVLFNLRFISIADTLAI